MRRFLARAPDTRGISFACGFVGGPRDALLAALTNATDMMEHHWRLFPATRLKPGLDMLVWNELAIGRFSWREDQSGVMTGYPYGPVNFPLRNYAFAHGLRGNEVEKHLAFFVATRGMFWLIHSLKMEYLPITVGWTLSGSCPGHEGHLLWPLVESIAKTLPYLNNASLYADALGIAL